MSDDTFSVWITDADGNKAEKSAGHNFTEPAEAVDAAEDVLNWHKPGAYAEIKFNGDREPHTIIFLMDGSKRNESIFGVFNTPSAMWPIYYADSPYGTILSNLPDGYEAQGMEGDESDEDGLGDEDEDSKVMDLGGGADDESDDDENEDSDDDEGDDSEGEEETDGEDENTDPDDDDEQGSDEDPEQDDDDEDEGENETPEDGEDEAEMPRLNIFAKMRGPKGWRKRAEAEELMERNVFGLKVGVLDTEAEKPGQQERNVIADIQFIESDETRDHGILKMRLPDGVTLEDFTQTKAGVITVKVPYGE